MGIFRTSFLPILGFIVISASCTGSETTGGGPSQIRSAAPEICSLSEEGDSFTCDMIYGKYVCENGPDNGARSEFIKRMTKISLEMLYLENEPGAQPPFRYTDPVAILAAVRIHSCNKTGESCICRLSYEDPDMKEIFYDSAGCRASSVYSSNPLYFRGRGC